LNLSRSQWLNDEKRIEAVQKEAEGLRSNETWDDDTVDTIQGWKAWADNANVKVHIADLLILCGIKHYELELEPSKWKYKGRIVYRGDRIRDSEKHNLVPGNDNQPNSDNRTADNFVVWLVS